MEIKSTRSHAAEGPLPTVDTKKAEEHLGQFNKKIDEYLEEFHKVFKQPENINNINILKLVGMRQGLEGQAKQFKETVADLDNAHPAKAQEIKKQYETKVSQLSGQVAEKVNGVLEYLGNACQSKLKEFSEGGANVKLALEIKNLTGTIKLIAKDFSAEIERLKSL